MPFLDRGKSGIKFDKWGLPKVDKNTFQSCPYIFGGDAAFGPKNIITAWAWAAVSIDRLNGKDIGPAT